MSKLFLSALALALLLVPAVQAQSHTVAVAISDLPATVLSNGTQAIVPFKVTATISGAAPCLTTGAGGATYTLDLDATLISSTGNSTSVFVNPAQATIAGPVALSPTGSGERVVDGTLVVNAGPYPGDFLNATVKVVATFAGSNGGCTGVPAAPASSDEATVRADFEPVRGFGSPASGGNEMPGPAAALMMLALVGLVALLRKN